MSDMQSKDIINTKTGARLGRIVDINVNSDGIINYLVVSSTKMMRKTGDYKITFKDIRTIGSDVIPVSYTHLTLPTT